ncbi:MAG: hypothetical protein JKX92_05945 [Porticoccaceae bacterium]|nr:hypothetical protein [Porticoccaceae bacterium]
MTALVPGPVLTSEYESLWRNEAMIRLVYQSRLRSLANTLAAHSDPTVQALSERIGQTLIAGDALQKQSPEAAHAV